MAETLGFSICGCFIFFSKAEMTTDRNDPNPTWVGGFSRCLMLWVAPEAHFYSPVLIASVVVMFQVEAICLNLQRHVIYLVKNLELFKVIVYFPTI